MWCLWKFLEKTVDCSNHSRVSFIMVELQLFPNDHSNCVNVFFCHRCWGSSAILWCKTHWLLAIQEFFMPRINDPIAYTFTLIGFLHYFYSLGTWFSESCLNFITHPPFNFNFHYSFHIVVTNSNGALITACWVVVQMCVICWRVPGNLFYKNSCISISVYCTKLIECSIYSIDNIVIYILTIDGQLKRYFERQF